MAENKVETSKGKASIFALDTDFVQVNVVLRTTTKTQGNEMDGGKIKV